MNNILDNKFSGSIVIGNKDNINLGDNVSFGGNVILYANEKIEVGEYTMIAINSLIHTSTHDYKDHPMRLKRIDRPVKIGKHVWVGANSVILPGVIIGDYSVIGAGSVVTANVPIGAIVAGNPARIIKYRNKNWYNKEMCIENNVKVNLGYINKKMKKKFIIF